MMTGWFNAEENKWRFSCTFWMHVKLTNKFYFFENFQTYRSSINHPQNGRNMKLFNVVVYIWIDRRLLHMNCGNVMEVTKQESSTAIFCEFSLYKDIIVTQLPPHFNPSFISHMGQDIQYWAQRTVTEYSSLM